MLSSATPSSGAISVAHSPKPWREATHSASAAVPPPSPVPSTMTYTCMAPRPAARLRSAASGRRPACATTFSPNMPNGLGNPPPPPAAALVQSMKSSDSTTRGDRSRSLLLALSCCGTLDIMNCDQSALPSRPWSSTAASGLGERRLPGSVACRWILPNSRLDVSPPVSTGTALAREGAIGAGSWTPQSSGGSA